MGSIRINGDSTPHFEESQSKTDSNALDSYIRKNRTDFVENNYVGDDFHHDADEMDRVTVHKLKRKKIAHGHASVPANLQNRELLRLSFEKCVKSDRTVDGDVADHVSDMRQERHRDVPETSVSGGKNLFNSGTVHFHSGEVKDVRVEHGVDHDNSKSMPSEGVSERTARGHEADVNNRVVRNLTVFPAIHERANTQDRTAGAPPKIGQGREKIDDVGANTEVSALARMPNIVSTSESRAVGASSQQTQAQKSTQARITRDETMAMTSLAESHGRQGTSVQYSFKTWAGQPSVNLHFVSNESTHLLSAAATRTDVAMALVHHADRLGSDVRLQCDEQDGHQQDWRDEGSSHQGHDDGAQDDER